MLTETENTNLVELTIAMPEDAVKSKAEQALEGVRALVIDTPDSYVVAANELAHIKGQYATVEAQRVELKAPILLAGRRVDALFQAPLEFYESAEKIVKSKMTDYDEKQKALRLEEQWKLDEIARKERETKETQAAEVARKAREKADSERRQAEEQRKAQERAQHEAAQRRADQERAQHEADEAKKRGDAAAAKAAEDAAAAARKAASAAESLANTASKEAAKLDARAERTAANGEQKSATIQAAASMIVAPVIIREPPKVVGLKRLESWHAECVDLRALVKAIAEGKAPLSLVVADTKVLGQQARSLKKEFVAPGVRVWSDNNLASGTA